MRKLLLPLLSTLLFTACQKEIAKEQAPKVAEPTSGIAAKSPAGKLDVCHYDAVNGTHIIININVKAWPEHEGHGDTRLDDADGDGFVPENACGFGTQGDCDDNNATIHPGATEICGNSIDENCDGEDENCIPSVEIGTQTWMLKNLDVSVYRNGDPIPQVTGGEWSFLTTGAWRYYNNDPATGATYGKLYNWYAVNDPRGLAPAGWHVPDNAEWITLVNFINDSEPAGNVAGKMKEMGTTHWFNNGDATNSSGFTALPGGLHRGGPGGIVSEDLQESGLWWTSDPSRYWSLRYNSDLITQESMGQQVGMSVRCVRD